MTDEAAPAQPARKRLRLLLTVAAVVLALDIVTKVLAVRLLTPGQPVSIVGDTITWTLVRNSGAAFSMATGYTWVLTLIAVASICTAYVSKSTIAAGLFMTTDASLPAASRPA